MCVLTDFAIAPRPFKASLAAAAATHFAKLVLHSGELDIKEVMRAPLVKPLLCAWVDTAMKDLNRPGLSVKAWGHLRCAGDKATVVAEAKKHHAEGTLFRKWKGKVAPEEPPQIDEPDGAVEADAGDDEEGDGEALLAEEGDDLDEEADVADDEEPPKEDEPEGVVEIEAPAPAPAPALGRQELSMAERLMGLRLMYGLSQPSTTG